MDIKDLMIGDWVLRDEDLYNKRYNGADWKPYKINKGKDFDDIDYYERIGILCLKEMPLTEDILEKNNFRKWEWWQRGKKDDVITYAIGNGFHVLKKEDGFDVVDNCDEGGDCGFEYSYICDTKYVHQLQNAMKLFGIKKEIIL